MKFLICLLSVIFVGVNASHWNQNSYYGDVGHQKPSHVKIIHRQPIYQQVYLEPKHVYSIRSQPLVHYVQPVVKHQVQPVIHHVKTIVPVVKYVTSHQQHVVKLAPSHDGWWKNK